MECFQVLESGEGIEQAILRRLSARGGLQGRCASGKHPALLVVSPRAAARGIPVPRQCRTVLLPGGMGGVLPRAASAVSYGVSPRDSLTLSSLAEPVLCVQRALPRPDGVVIDPQEFPLPPLPGPAEALLPILGLRLLQMPLTEGCFP